MLAFESRHVNCQKDHPITTKSVIRRKMKSTVTTSIWTLMFSFQLKITKHIMKQKFGKEAVNKRDLGYPDNWFRKMVFKRRIKCLLYFAELLIILINVWELHLPCVPEINLIWSWRLHVFPLYIVSKIGFLDLHDKSQKPLSLAFFLLLFWVKNQEFPLKHKL